jgi:hypothetical protein
MDREGESIAEQPVLLDKPAIGGPAFRSGMVRCSQVLSGMVRLFIIYLKQFMTIPDLMTS